MVMASATQFNIVGNALYLPWCFTVLDVTVGLHLYEEGFMAV
jgi:hypothetical protein